ncbi:MAG: protein translocase subunit SecF [Ignavibacteriaceae bacterium]
MRILQNINYDFLGKRKTFYIVSLVAIVAGILSILIRGLEYGVDFSGGSEIVVQFEKPVDLAQIRDEIGNIGIGNVEIKTFGGDNTVLIRTDLQNIPPNVYPNVVANIEKEINAVFPGVPRTVTDSTDNSITYEFQNPDTASTLASGLFRRGFQSSRVSEEVTNRQVIVSVGISDWIKQNLRESVTDNEFTVIRAEQVGPKVGRELKENAIVAIVLSLIVILVYLGFRFKFVFAFGAVVALFHNVLITLGLFSILYNVIPGLNLEIDLNVVAAFLTLVGYTINDTVVIYDRIRENMKIHKTLPLLEVINRSINNTMSRTVLTGGTTLAALLILLFFGGEVLRSFAFTLFFGILIGTYSSVFIASALVLEYSSRAKRKVQF